MVNFKNLIIIVLSIIGSASTLFGQSCPGNAFGLTPPVMPIVNVTITDPTGCELIVPDLGVGYNMAIPAGWTETMAPTQNPPAGTSIMAFTCDVAIEVVTTAQITSMTTPAEVCDLMLISTITPVDVTPPSFVCPTTIPVFEGCDLSALTFADLMITVEDCSATTGTIDPIVVPQCGLDAALDFEINVTGIISDACGNDMPYLCRIGVEDTTAPVIDECPFDGDLQTIPVDADCEFIMPDYTSLLVISDNCDLGSYTIDQTPAVNTPLTVGLIDVSFIVTDCNNNATVSTVCFQIDLVDETLPVLDCSPTPRFRTLNANCMYEAPDFSALIGVTDNCDMPPPAAVQISPAVGDLFGLADSPVTFSFEATDAAGNVGTCSFEIILEDGTVPMISCPDPPLDFLGCEVATLTPAQLGIIVDDCNASLMDVIITGLDNIDPCMAPGLIPYTASVTDDNNNTTTIDCEINIIDDAPPELQRPRNVFINCTDDIDPVSIEANYGRGLPRRGTDDCSAGVLEADIAAIVGGSWAPNQIVTINGLSFSYEDDPVTIDLDCMSANPALADVKTRIRRIWTLTDECGKEDVTNIRQFINIIDTTDPVITCPSDITQDADPGLCGANLTMAIPTVTDDCPGTVTLINDFNMTGDASGFYPVGTTMVNWTAEDACGNVIMDCIVTVIIEDGTAPVFDDCPMDIAVEITDPNPLVCTATVMWTVPTMITEACMLDVAIDPTITDALTGLPLDPLLIADPAGAGVTLDPGIYEVCYFAQDVAGNLGECCFEVRVEEFDAGALSCIGLLNLGLDNNCEVELTPAMAITTLLGCPDNYEVNFVDNEGTLLGNMLDGSFKNTTMRYQICLPIRDICCWGDVNIIDDTPPTINVVSPVTGLVCNGLDAIAPPTAMDNCSGATVELVNEVITPITAAQCADPMYANLSSIVTRTYEAVDFCGNRSMPMDQVIHLERLDLGVLTCPEPSQVECSSGYDVDENGNPSPSAAGSPTICRPQTAAGLPVIGFTFLGSQGSSYYYVSDSGSSWEDANTLAQANGGHLACISTSFENTFLTGAISALSLNAAWIGLNDLATPGTFEWVCGDPLLYTAWEAGQPDNSLSGTPGYVELLAATGTWNDNDDITTEQVFILEFDEAEICLPISAIGINQYCNSFARYTDQTDTLSSCAIDIIRVWEIREWHCSGEEVTTCMQEIKIRDTEGPVVACPAPREFSTNPGYDCEAHIEFPEFTPVDACDNGPFTFEYALSTGIILPDVDNVFLGLGAHTIVITITDECGSATVCEWDITVVDRTQPVAICESDLIVSISGVPNVEVLAENFDDGSWDECDHHGLTLEVARIVTECDADDLNYGTSVHFCCADIGNDPMVALRVTDKSGNTNICMVAVEIQDKYAPVLTCPANVTVDCTTDFDFNNLSNTYGSPLDSDNCMTGMVEEDVDNSDYTDNNCGIGDIIRTFTVTDEGGFSSTCEQVITVVDMTPFGRNDIDFPDDFDSDICDFDLLDPEDLEMIDVRFGFPQYEEDECELIGYNYVDEDYVFNGNDDVCLKIIRKWKVINWCGMGAAGFDVWEHEQVIKVENDTPPVIGNCDEKIECTFDADCGPGEIELINTATATCNTNGVLWTYAITDAETGAPIANGTTADASGTYELGSYEILWSVTDQCGNEATCIQAFTVRNCKSPIPICKQVSINIESDPDNDGVENIGALLTTASFDGGTYHSCDNMFALHFQPNDVNSTDTIIECLSGPNPLIRLYVTDLETGSSDYCEQRVIVDDTDNNLCTNFVDEDNTISGGVSTENAENIQNVSLNLIGANTAPQLTDSEGNYIFPSMPDGGDYSVKPSLDIDPLNGVSTLDLVMIQRYILGSGTITSPYKLIAADINNDNQISAIDLLELRKVILGVNPTFPNNESWKFIDQGHRFTDNTNPWSSPIAYNYEIHDLSNDMNIDFVGLKVGDVNNSVEFLGKSSTVATRSNDALQLLYEITDDRINFYLEDDVQLDGFQIDVECNEDVSFQKVESEVIGLDAHHYHVDESNQNSVRISWSSDGNKATQLKADQVLFSLDLENTSNDVDLEVVNEWFRSEMYWNGQVADIILRERVTEQVNTTTEEGLVVYQNSPNPWGETTMIKFYIPEETNVDIRFFNVHGQLIKASSAVYRAGMHHLKVKRSDLDVSGVIIYEIVYKDEAISKRMILVD